MKQHKNIKIKGQHQRPVIADLCYEQSGLKKPLVIFCHGYKGYKDWGAFDLMSASFAAKGLVLLKFNFSHNGGTFEQPIDFPDLEAFGMNNYSKEQDDLATVLDWIFSFSEVAPEINFNDITLIGHSRGGGAVALKAAQDTRVTRLITWASVSDFAMRFPTGAILDTWKKEGVAYIENARTRQQMPHYIQFYEDFIANREKLTIKTAVQSLKIPHLIIHGTDDASVPLEEAENLHRWNPESTLFLIPDADHGFGSKQPWEEPVLPKDFETVLSKTFEFIKQTD